MATVGRNQPCPCGSGRKAKHCCGVQRGPSEDELGRAFLAVQRRWAKSALASCTRAQIQRLFREVLELPQRDLSLAIPLPPVLTPELERLSASLGGRDRGAMTRALDAALPGVDTPALRARLARAVLALRDRGDLGDAAAAAALLHLDSPADGLIQASLVRSLAVRSGAATTPAGILIARR